MQTRTRIFKSLILHEIRDLVGHQCPDIQRGVAYSTRRGEYCKNNNDTMSPRVVLLPCKEGGKGVVKHVPAGIEQGLVAAVLRYCITL